MLKSNNKCLLEEDIGRRTNASSIVLVHIVVRIIMGFSILLVFVVHAVVDGRWLVLRIVIIGLNDTY